MNAASNVSKAFMSFQLALRFIVDQPWKYVFSEKIETAQNSHIPFSRNMWRRDWLLYKPMILRADCFGELDYSSMKIKSWWCACPVPTPLYDHWRRARLCSLGHHCQSGPGISSPWRVAHTSKLPPFEIRIHCHVTIASTTCCWNLFGSSGS